MTRATAAACFNSTQGATAAASFTRLMIKVEACIAVSPELVLLE